MKYLLTGLLIFFMYSQAEAYNPTATSFFSFTGKIFSKEKTCVVHYSYDVHGNVKTLIQDNAGVGIPEQRYKKMEYEYDLISGKVNAVHYQNNQPDQFHHKYEYDADNRLTDVYTSKDKTLWDHDAKYFYYPHGPLARVELGDNHVQGIDFAYTLQGWIKGINSETLNETRDMGHDGNNVSGNPNAHFAKDAFGYSLTYFEGDYQSIGTSSFEANKTNSDLLKARNDLFNGNISAMVTTLVPPTLNGNTISYSPLPQGTAYKYDQLNRLVEMQAWQNIDAVNNTWGSGLTYNGMYHNKFTYDGNGNILMQLRKDQSGAAINELTYNRIKDGNGKLLQNRLYWVNDAVDKDVFADDIDDQQSGNYAYDEIGNLTQNNQKEIAEIKYTVYGKVKEVIRTAGSNKKNLKFDYDATGNRVAKHVYSSAWVWEKSEFYSRDAQGNVMSIYKNENDVNTQTQSFAQIEKHIYGSTKIGTEKTKVELIGAPSINTTKSVRMLGNKEFEGSNHLGNILTTFTDRKIPIDANNDGTIDEYWPHVLSSTDYYPFGVAMKERSFSDTARRYGFNGKEFDGETGTSDFGARNEDGDLGIVETPDPLNFVYPGTTPYSAMGGNPIANVDYNGKLILYFGGLWPTMDDKPQLKNFNYWDVELRANISYTYNDYAAMYFNGEGSLNAVDRYEAGRKAAMLYAGDIARALRTQQRFNPDTKLHVVGHSMGVAYSAGWVQTLREAKDENGNLLFKDSDFGDWLALAPYDAKDITAPSFMNSKQFSATYDPLAGDNQIKNIGFFRSNPFHGINPALGSFDYRAGIAIQAWNVTTHMNKTFSDVTEFRTSQSGRLPSNLTPGKKTERLDLGKNRYKLSLVPRSSGRDNTRTQRPMF